MSAFKRRAPLDDEEDETAGIALAEEDQVAQVAQEIQKVVDLEVKPVTKPVRPFSRVAKKQKVVSEVNLLLSQIVHNQENFQNKLSPYEQAIKILKATFSAELSVYEEMDFIGLLAENPPFVDQFLTFTDAQRTIFIQRKLAANNRDQL